jgi:epoxyqueuosine reductase
MDSAKTSLRRKATALGFALCGFTAPDPPARFDLYASWIAAGRHGGMSFLAAPRAMEARARPLALLPSARSIISLAVPYPRPRGDADAASGGWVAACAQGDDYHDVIPHRLRALCAEIDALAGKPVAHRMYVDAGPVLEREIASRAGLGWIGRNSLLIHPELGSHFFLAEILTAYSFPPDDPFPADRCGTCDRCLRACPTDCIRSDRTIDARRCIAYLTMEHRGPIPPDARGSVGRRVFGCDSCQTVCPWNQETKADVENCFLPRAHFPLLHPENELLLGEEELRGRFRRSALRRTGRAGYRRNIAVVLGNGAGMEALPALQAALQDSDPGVRESAQWAIARIGEARQSPGKQPVSD